MNLFTKGGLTIFFCAIIAFISAADTVPLASLSDTSIAPASSTGSGDSGMPIISADGRYVLFASTANNLAVSNNAAAPTLMPFFNVYLRDRTNGTTTLVSVNFSGNGGGNGDSVPRGISTNGQFVLFESTARNLTTNNASTNAVTFPGDVYVRDVANSTTTLVSANTNGVGPNSASSSVMSADGHLVAFASTSTTLVPGDANNIKDVFVRNLQTRTNAMVSVGAMAGGTATNFSESPAMTPDGRYVVFYSTATNLVPGVQTIGEIYERDLQAGTTTWVSKDARNLFFANVGTSNEVACNFKVSDDGNFIAFESCTNPAANSLSNLARGIILRHNMSSNTTDLIETNANVPITAFESIHTLDMTPDGRFVAYVNNVNGLGQPTLGVSVWDAQSATSILVSVNTNGVASTGAFCDSPAISTNGRFVSFVSSATDLVSNSIPSGYHAYLRNTLGGATRLVDADLSGAGAGVNYGAIPNLSADGSTVAYESSTPNVVSNDLNLRFDVFVVNTASNGTELVSARDAALPSVTPRGPSGQYTYSVSTTGRYVAFASDSDDLALNDTNGWRDVFVRDMLTGTSTLVSVATNGFSGTGMSFEPAISGNGRYVAFSSYVTNLVSGDTTNVQEVYGRDLQFNTTAMVSLAMDGVSPGNSNSFQPSISADGRFVLFHSQSSNLAPGSFGNGIENLFLRDLQLGTTYALTASTSGTGVVSAAMTPDGRFVTFIGPSTGTILRVWNTQLAAFTYSNSIPNLGGVWISPDGQRVAYLAASTLNVTDLVSQTHWALNAGTSFGAHPGVQFSADDQFLVYSTTAANVAADVNGLLDVYLYSFQNSSYTLISSRLNPNLANDSPADSSALSADGRFVVYRSASTNIVADATNGLANLYVYDRGTGTNALLTQSRFGGGAAAGQSRTPVFSGDGRTVVFQSWASDLATDDFNTAGDMFAYSFFYLNETLASSSPAVIVLNWPVIPGQTYQAQYKTNLTDVEWQNLGGVVGIMGNQAFLTNPYVPFNAQQFYRVTAH